LPRNFGWPNVFAAVHGQQHVVAINSGTTYLSFAITMAGFTNVKVGIFEAAACGACILVQDFDELHNYFKPGQEIVTYISEQDAVDKAHYFRKNPGHAIEIGQAARRRVLAEHTWEHRWRKVLGDVYELH
jgi:spore maturation protein CgeB